MNLYGVMKAGLKLERKMSYDEKADTIKEACELIVGKKIDGKSCAICGCLKVTPEDFADALSRKEFEISRMCQKCQDSIFDEEE